MHKHIRTDTLSVWRILPIFLDHTLRQNFVLYKIPFNQFDVSMASDDINNDYIVHKVNLYMNRIRTELKNKDMTKEMI